MKCRSVLLVACLVVVPSLAMFSHMIPAPVRAAIRRGLRDSLADLVGRSAVAGGLTATSPPGENGLVAFPEGETARVAVTVDARASGDQRMADVGSTATPVQNPPPLVAQFADRSRQARDQQSIEARLRDMGAIAFDCQRLPGADGLHSSSCRLPVDTAGQLQRVFQATGLDPVSAAENLLLQVSDWLQRTKADSSSASATAGQATRFR